MKICILNPSYEASNSTFKGFDPPCDPRPHAPEHQWDQVFLDKAAAVSTIVKLASAGYDLFFQLCDGAWDEDRAGIEVVQCLERLGLPFTGANSAWFDPTRDSMKRVCHATGIPTPEHAMARTRADLVAAAGWMTFPLIVKHPASYGSVGMTRACRVMTVEALIEEGMRLVDLYGQVLVERFIEGREFTVLVSENADDPARPHAYPPIECQFPAGETFKHFDLKWKDFDALRWVSVTDLGVAAQLQDFTARMFLAYGGQGYGRCDFRMGSDGVLQCLEINANCGVLYPQDSGASADEILALDPKGPRGFVRSVIDAALARHRRTRPAFEIRWRPAAGWGMFASRDLLPRDVIDRWEEREHVLVTRRQVATWSAQKADWFGRYAWPLTDEVYVMWSANPDQWTPIDHSCDPNGWLEGLDLVARRAISVGESITMDYATFCGPLTTPFDCTCSASQCRGRVGPQDHRNPEFVALYGDHVSDYVRQALSRVLA